MSQDAGMVNPFVDGSFVCLRQDSVGCQNNVHFYCERNGEFLSTVQEDCNQVQIEGRRSVCVPELGCSFCRPGEVTCVGDDAVSCNAAGTSLELIEHCDTSAGLACRRGRCASLCAVAVQERSYLGCEFYPVDLDNAGIDALRNASAQQFSVVVSNPGGIETDVWVEINRAAPGEPPVIEELESVTVLPGDLEVLDLPRREVDGSSSMMPCAATAECNFGEACWCAGPTRIEDSPGAGVEHTDCRCRNAGGTDGINDGTHTAVTPNAFRLRSTLPIVAYQFNPLDNVGVFSNDASLLLPSSAIPPEPIYSVIGWPQTIANSSDANEDFDSTTTDEDLRAFLSVVGTAETTHVRITFGPQVRRVVGLGDRPAAVPGTVWDVDIGAFDVLNLETEGFNADFTGTQVEASQRVMVYSGSEASDAPRFASLANRQCCADHLEEQLFPNEALGRNFYIARQPPRTSALNAAFIDPTVDSVGEFNEPEFIRILAIGSGVTTVTTTLPAPDDLIMLEQGQNVILWATQDFEMQADKTLAVLQVIASQEAVGIPSYYPGGDPSIIAVPPLEQYRRDYVFLTPGLYAFDFVTITAPRIAEVLLDETPIDMFVAMGDCEVAPADGIPRQPEDPLPEWVIYRCQLSFPDVFGRNQAIAEGLQNDGYHTLRSNFEVGLVVSGFDRFVSYGYAGGSNLDPIE